MKITTTVSKVIEFDDGSAVYEGSMCAFNYDGKCVVGIFDGFSEKNGLKFLSPFDGEPGFVVMPKSITAIHHIDISRSEK